VINCSILLFTHGYVQIVDYLDRPLPNKVVTAQTFAGIPMKIDLYDNTMSSYGASLDMVNATSDSGGMATLNGLYMQGGKRGVGGGKRNGPWPYLF
jgi:hypothetical protein